MRGLVFFHGEVNSFVEKLTLSKEEGNLYKLDSFDREGGQVVAAKFLLIEY